LAYGLGNLVGLELGLLLGLISLFLDEVGYPSNFTLDLCKKKLQLLLKP
jgi:hypothetical protein